MKRFSQRLLAFLLCLLMLTAEIPALATDEAVEIAAVEATASVQAEEPKAEPEPEPEPKPEPEPETKPESKPEAEPAQEPDNSGDASDNSDAADPEAPADPAGEDPAESEANGSDVSESAGDSASETGGTTSEAAAVPEESPAPADGEDASDSDSQITDEETLPPEDAAETESIVVCEDMPLETSSEEAAEEDSATADSVTDAWIADMLGKNPTSDYEKALILHDRLMDSVKPATSDTAEQSAESALIDGFSGSRGYAEAYALLLKKAGIESRLLEAKNGIDAWNAVKLDGAWYHIDCFADDVSDRHWIYFALTDKAIARDHSWSTSAAPACSGTKYNYYVREKGYTAVTDDAELQELVTGAAEAGLTELRIYLSGDDLNLQTRIPEILDAAGYSAELSVSRNYCFAVCGMVCSAKAPVLPDSITAEKSSITIGVKECVSVAGWKLSPADASAAVKYTSKSKSIAKVDSAGNVTGVAAGTTYITIKTDNGKTCSVKVVVKKAPTSVKLSSSRTVLGVDETITAKATLSSGSAGSRVFSDDAENPVLTIDPASGLITACKPGTETVKVTTYNGKTASRSISVVDMPSAIALSAGERTLGIKDSFTLGYTLDPENPEYRLAKGASGMATYASSDPSIAKVDPASGKVTAVSPGSTQITATTYNGVVSEACTVTAVPAPTSLSLKVYPKNSASSRTTLGVKETAQISTSYAPEGATGSLKYSSSKKSVATVSSKGVITAKYPGTAYITVKAYNGVKKSVKITVKKAPTSVKLSSSRTVLGVDETITAKATLSSGSAGSRVFSDDAENPVLTIDPASGLITACKPGTETVKVTTYNGKTASRSISVVDMPSAIALSAGERTLGIKDSFTLGYTLDPENPEYPLANGASGMATYASSDPSIAKVDPASGKVTAVSPGSTQITATTYNGVVSEACTVTAVPAPTSLSLKVYPKNSASSRTTLGVKETAQISTSYAPEGATGSLKYSSSKKSVATVSSKGVITAKYPGTAYITVKAYNGVKKSVKITVRKAPTSVKLSSSRTVLGVDETITAKATLSSGSAGSRVFSDDAENPVLTIDPASGLITACKPGTETVKVKTFNGKTASLGFTVKPAPESISMTLPAVLSVGQTCSPAIALTPEDSCSPITYSIVSGSGAAISDTGKITVSGTGSIVIRAQTYIPEVYTEQEITLLPAPEKLWFDQTKYDLSIDATLQLEPHITEGTVTSFTYKSASTKILKVSADGLVTPVKGGTTKITVTTHNGLTATLTVRVFDPNYPESIEWIEKPPAYLDLGKSYTPLFSVFPETAQPNMLWKSSNSKIVVVDSQTGVINAKSYGKATITGTSQVNTALKLSYTIVVLSDDRCLVVPDRRITGISSMTEAQLNSRISILKAQVSNIKESAYDELEALYYKGVISSSDMSKRKTIISNAFKMYSFPWITNSKQPYWKAANSEGGAKDYKPGILYFGLPYTQHYENRKYNVSKALSEGRWTDSGKNYYVLNRSKLVNGSYCGNDCSSFASIATRGMNNSGCFDNTTAIASSSDYKTITSSSNLRPGDLLCWSGHHVIMFLYFADAAHTQMMLIEQGGGEAGTNTVSCSIKSISSYTGNGYKIRRLKSLG